MRNTTPKKIISLKPKLVEIQQKNQTINPRAIQKLQSPPQGIAYVPHKVMYSPPPPTRIEPRLLSPPTPQPNQNILFRPISMKGLQASNNHNQSISNTVDVRNRIPPLMLKKPEQVMHSPRIVDSIVISKPNQEYKSPQTDVFKQKQIHRTINLIQKPPSQTTIQTVKNSPRKDLLISKLRERQLPIRYEPFRMEKYSQKSSNSQTNISQMRVEQSQKKIEQQRFLNNQTVTSSGNKLAALTKKMEEIVKINENLELKLEQLSEQLIQKDDENKRVKRKITELTDKYRQIKKQFEKTEDQTIQYKIKTENEIDNIKIQYGADLFTAQAELNNLTNIRRSTEAYVSSLEKQQFALQTQLNQFRSLFNNIRVSFSQVNI